MEGVQRPKDADAQQEGPGPEGRVGKPSLGGKPGDGNAGVKGSVESSSTPTCLPGAGPEKQVLSPAGGLLGPSLGMGPCEHLEDRQGGRVSVTGLPVQPWMVGSFPPRGPGYPEPQG